MIRKQKVMKIFVSIYIALSCDHFLSVRGNRVMNDDRPLVR
jgi:hypothetical protein